MEGLEIGLYRYLVTVHSVACALVLFQHLMLGLRATSHTPAPARVILWACRIIPVIQFPVSLIRVVFSLSPEFKVSNPAEAYLDFFWSPMLTIVMIWLVQLYLAKRCCRISKLCSPSEVYAPVRPVFIVLALSVGIASSAAMWRVMQSMGQWLDMHMRILAFGALLLALVETAAMRFMERGGISLTSYSWLWFLGTWLYFIPKV